MIASFAADPVSGRVIIAVDSRGNNRRGVEVLWPDASSSRASTRYFGDWDARAVAEFMVERLNRMVLNLRLQLDETIVHDVFRKAVGASRGRHHIIP